LLAYSSRSYCVEKLPRISLVIPAYNEEHFLALLLDSIDASRQQYQAGADQIEVIVADNRSTDGTADLARARGCRVVRVDKRSIAAARNGGARMATGEIVAFVDADSQIHPDTFNAIERTLKLGRVIVGATGARFSRRSLGIIFTTLCALICFQLTGFDTGVVFCRRADWETVGGYNEERLWADDAGFLITLKRLGRTRGQRFARAKGAVTITSARKFDRYGDWHVFTILLPSFVQLIFNRSGLHQFVHSYWYGDRP
jgi:glycosyltransferase involved in cell wall biosynthesis